MLTQELRHRRTRESVLEPGGKGGASEPGESDYLVLVVDTTRPGDLAELAQTLNRLPLAWWRHTAVVATKSESVGWVGWAVFNWADCVDLLTCFSTLRHPSPVLTTPPLVPSQSISAPAQPLGPSISSNSSHHTPQPLPSSSPRCVFTLPTLPTAPQSHKPSLIVHGWIRLQPSNLPTIAQRVRRLALSSGAGGLRPLQGLRVERPPRFLKADGEED